MGLDKVKTWFKNNWQHMGLLLVGGLGIMVGIVGVALAVQTKRELNQLAYTVRHDLGDPDATRLGRFTWVPTLDADGKPVMIPCPGQPGAQCTKTHRVRQSAWKEMELLDGRIYRLAYLLEGDTFVSKYDLSAVRKLYLANNSTPETPSVIESAGEDNGDPVPVVEGPLDGDVLPGDPGFDRQVSDFCSQNPEKRADGKFYLTGCTEGGSTYVDKTFVCTSWDSTPPYLHGCDEVR